jgi:hypothetical protein
VIAVVFAGVAASFDVATLAAWVPVATTASTSVIAYVAATRYDHQIIEFLCCTPGKRFRFTQSMHPIFPESCPLIGHDVG